MVKKLNLKCSSIKSFPSWAALVVEYEYENGNGVKKDEDKPFIGYLNSSNVGNTDEIL